MNDQYSQKIHQILSNNILNRICELDITVKSLSDKSDVPYETIKKLISGNTLNPSLMSCYKISQALDMTIAELTSDSNPDKYNTKALVPRAKEFLWVLCEIEYSVGNWQKNAHIQSEILLYSCIIDENDELMLNDSIPAESISFPVSSRLCECIFAIQLPDDRYHPVYYKDDIIVVSGDRFPENGDATVFVQNNKLYIEKYVTSAPRTFIPINERKSLFNGDTSDIIVFGYVFSVLRCE